MNDAERGLDDLEQRDAFVGRHIGPTAEDQRAMLRHIGVVSMDAFVDQVVPPSIRSSEPMDLDKACTETEALAEIARLADANQVYRSLIGMGYYGSHLPSVIQRNLLENPAWYTAYTPYQAEISQGRLEALLNFQTMVMDLTGMELANASLLDEATAAAEAMAMCQRLSRSKSACFFVDSGCHPQTLAVVRTRAEPLGIKVVVGSAPTDLARTEVFAALLQYPDSRGEVGDHSAVIEQLHQRKAMAVVATDLLALTLLRSPGEMGADVVVGSSQRFGVPMGYGGPHAAFLATRDANKRATPGRIIGVSADSRGEPAYRMALQTREQHIRREKATSNICTAQALLAIIASMYAVYHGPEGLRTIARRTHRLTRILALGLSRLGVGIETRCYFDTLTLRSDGNADAILRAARARRINLRQIDADRVGVALDETVDRDLIAALLEAFAEVVGGAPSAVSELDQAVVTVIPGDLQRQGAILSHPVFHRHHSETAMLRYMRHLADKDLALDRSMIPLGSCTMKLNATSEMMPIGWPGFCALHPFAPLDQARGYHDLFKALESMLCACTGYDAVSLQPNSGAQGEYSGLLAIRAYHRSRGEGHRDVCLIPSSAHGTNPASAHLAGMRVVVVQCDAEGNVDLDDLRAKAAQHADALAAAMVTYPSTHGVFETTIRELCDLVHEFGGQVYLDGANLNAQVGLAAPGHYGADVSHLNLHKTFCIPHGGGGPGVGPIGVRAHLAPFLPKMAVFDTVTDGSVGPVSAAPWGSAGILPITWMYIRMMGRQGLVDATRVALLNANYIARRLRAHYPVLYTGASGMVAHECILDLRPIKEQSGVTVDDVAKRLVDYGFHSPTMSFPVAGTLMIEPTESESKVELDRFCDAMIEIRKEIQKVAEGTWPQDDNPLRNAPHTVSDLADSDWSHPYTREQAAFPLAGLRQYKYWSPVGRIDNVQGDRNLVCSCPPIESYQGVA